MVRWRRRGARASATGRGTPSSAGRAGRAWSRRSTGRARLPRRRQGGVRLERGRERGGGAGTARGGRQDRDARQGLGVRGGARAAERPGGAGVLPPPAPPVAEGDQREHQRALQGVPPEGHGPVGRQRRGGQKSYAVTMAGRIVAGSLALNQSAPYFRYSSKNAFNFSNGMTST